MTHVLQKWKWPSLVKPPKAFSFRGKCTKWVSHPAAKPRVIQSKKIGVIPPPEMRRKPVLHKRWCEEQFDSTPPLPTLHEAQVHPHTLRLSPWQMVGVLFLLYYFRTPTLLSLHNFFFWNPSRSFRFHTSCWLDYIDLKLYKYAGSWWSMPELNIIYFLSTP